MISTTEALRDLRIWTSEEDDNTEQEAETPPDPRLIRAVVLEKSQVFRESPELLESLLEECADPPPPTLVPTLVSGPSTGELEDELFDLKMESASLQRKLDGLSDTLAATLGRLHAEILDTGARSAAAANIPERQARPRSVTAGPSVGRPTSFVMHALGSSAAGSSAIHALGLSAASSGGGETLSGGLWRAGDGKEEEEEERLPAGGLHERLEALLAELRGGPPGDGELEDDHEDDDEDDDGEVSCRDGGGGGSSHLHGNGEVDGEYDDGPVDGLAGAGLDGRGSDAELEDMVTGLSGQGRTINSGKLGISNLDMSSFQRPADAEARLPEVSQGAWPPAPSRDNRKPSAAGNSSSHDGHRLCSALELGGVRDGLEGMFLQPGATLAGFVDRPDLWFPPEDDDEAVEQDGDDVSTLGGGGMSSGGLAPRQGGDGDTWDGVSMIPGLARLSSRLDELQCMQLKLALAASNVRKCLQHMTERLNEGEDEEGPSAGSKST